MVRTEIPTTYGQLTSTDIIWLDDQAWHVMDIAPAADVLIFSLCLTGSEQRKQLIQSAGDPVYRQHRV